MLRRSVDRPAHLGGPRAISGAFDEYRRAVTIVHGGVKFYRGAAAAARAYVEADHSRADDYYLAEGSGVAERLVWSP